MITNRLRQVFYAVSTPSSAVSNPAAQKALITAAGMAGEGFEEFYSEVAHKLLNDSFLASDARTWDEVLGDAGRSALLGAVVSGLVSGVSHLTNPTPQELADYVEDSVRNVGLDTDTDLVSEPVDVNSEKFAVDTKTGEAYNTQYDVVLKLRADWSDIQIAEATEKINALSNAMTVKTKVVRSSRSARTLYESVYGKGSIPKGHDIDHVIDLQLGGFDDISNLKPLDRSVNRSLGKQIQNAIKQYPDGTRFGHFYFQENE